jgi:hypothetical protein
LELVPLEVPMIPMDANGTGFFVSLSTIVASTSL